MKSPVRAANLLGWPFYEILTLLCTFLLIVPCTPKNPPDTKMPSNLKKPPPVLDPAAAILVGAGDIASCDDFKGAAAIAKLIDAIAGTVFAAGLKTG